MPCSIYAAGTSTCRLMTPFPTSSLFSSLEAGTRVLEAVRLSKTEVVTVEPLYRSVASAHSFPPSATEMTHELAELLVDVPVAFR